MFVVGQKVQIKSGMFEGEVGTYDGEAQTGSWVKIPVTETTPPRRLWFPTGDLQQVETANS